MTPSEITARVMDYLAKLIPPESRADVHFVMFVSDLPKGENSMICSMGSVDKGMAFARAHIESLGKQPNQDEVLPYRPQGSGS